MQDDNKRPLAFLKPILVQYISTGALVSPLANSCGRYYITLLLCGNKLHIFMPHTFLSAPACTDMVNSKELERDVTTSAMAKAILRLKTVVFIPS